MATSVLLAASVYPGRAGDFVSYSYNRQGQVRRLTDQNETEHQYDYDLLGRRTQDRVTTLGHQIDGTVRRLGVTYDVRGLVQKLTSYSSANVGSGSVVNEVRFTYSNFGLSTKTYQAHGGAVNTSTSPNVQMSYATGSANTVRPTGMTYPDGRQLTFSYGTTNGINESLSRLQSIIDDDSTHLADYSYLGLGGVVEQASPQADLLYTLVSLTGSDDPDTGDIYVGLDRFGRIKDSRWRNTGSDTDLARVEYGYNRDSSRLWRRNPTDSNNFQDWLYTYDGVQRLQTADRGTLNTGHSGLDTLKFAQCWTLDETGNWSGFREDDNGDGTWDLVQARTSDEVNEITDIDNTVGSQRDAPVYDAAGNMTGIPRAFSGGLMWKTFTADQWDVFTADQWAGFRAVDVKDVTYDAWNRLVKIRDLGDTVQENAYDARGFRIVIKSYTSGTLSETRHVYYTDGWQAVEERLGSSTTPDRQFVWGAGYIDSLLLRDRTTTSTLDERLYALQDANWNVTALVDTDGDVQQRMEYDPYGNPRFFQADYTPTTNGYAWEYLFTGRTYDSGTQLYQFRNRFYSSELGLFLTRDPEEQFPNLYLYGDANPVIFTDPMGLATIFSPDQIEDLRRLFADSVRYRDTPSVPLPLNNWARSEIMYARQQALNAVQTAEARLAHAITEEARQKAAKTIALQSARASLLNRQLGRYIAYRAIPVVGTAAAVAAGMNIGTAMAEAEFGEKLNRGCLTARNRATSHSQKYFDSIINEQIVSCENFDEDVLDAWATCYRIFTEMVYREYYIEVSGGNAANINNAAMEFEKCLTRACKDSSNGESAPRPK